MITARVRSAVRIVLTITWLLVTITYSGIASVCFMRRFADNNSVWFRAAGVVSLVAVYVIALLWVFSIPGIGDKKGKESN